MIIGIDPSFTGTGICVCRDDGSYIESLRFSSKVPVYESIASAQCGAHKVSDFINDVVSKYKDEEVNVVIEYPAFATASGAFLGILNGWLGKLLHDNFNFNSVCWLPPIACNSYIGLKSSGNKTEDKKRLVEYVMDNYGVPKMSHDEATALIFTDIINGRYKKTFCWTKPYNGMEDSLSKKRTKIKKKKEEKEVKKGKKAK